MFGLSKVLWVKPKTVVHCEHVRTDNLEDLVVVKFGKYFPFVSNGIFGERNVKNFEERGFPLMQLKFLFCRFSL